MNPSDASEGLNINQTTPLICKCGNHTFESAFFLRKVSALVSPTGKEGVVPIPTFTCAACGMVPESVLPPFIRAEAESKVEQQRTDAGQGTATPALTKGNLTLLKD